MSAFIQLWWEPSQRLQDLDLARSLQVLIHLPTQCPIKWPLQRYNWVQWDCGRGLCRAVQGERPAAISKYTTCSNWRQRGTMPFPWPFSLPTPSPHNHADRPRLRNPGVAKHYFSIEYSNSLISSPNWSIDWLTDFWKRWAEHRW